MSVTDLDIFRQSRTGMRSAVRIAGAGAAVPVVVDSPAEVSHLRVVPTASSPAVTFGSHGDSEGSISELHAVQLHHSKGTEDKCTEETPLRNSRVAKDGDDVALGLLRAIYAVAVIAGILALTVVGLFIGSLFSPAPTQVVTVQQGDTVWSIAASVPGAPSTEVAVHDIQSLNNVSGDRINPGTVLEVPVY